MRAYAMFAVLMAAALPEMIQSPRWTTNSAAAAKRGTDLYRAGDFSKAAEMFRVSAGLDDSSRAAFNAGTAEIASRNYTKGSAIISRAASDPVLRPGVHYNRGNSALGANAFDYAIRDYTAALRLRPGDRDAKRNLEIALRKKEKADEPQKSPEQQNQPSEPQNSNEQPDQKTDEGSAESLLRSVEQQEREELRRMRRSKPEPEKVGW